MKTVFSHIVQKRFSKINEDVVTDALAYVLESSEAASRGMTKFLRGILPDLPQLYFRTQQVEGSIRPDMWGFDTDAEPRVFVENKFWAGLTDHQPVSYLHQLAAYPKSTMLLVIAPAAREQTLWRELNRRLDDSGISTRMRETPAGVAYAVDTEIGPILAIASWTSILSVLEHETVKEPSVRGDLVQLRSLCDAADVDVFTPINHEELSDQRFPAFVMQLCSIVQAVTDLAVSEKVISIGGLRPASSWDRIGRYIKLPDDETRGAGAWFGIRFDLWKSYGATPLWLVFSNTAFGRAKEVQQLLEPWAIQKGIFTTSINNHDMAVALEIPAGEEKDGVVRSIANDLKAIAAALESLPPHSGQIVTPRDDNEASP